MSQALPDLYGLLRLSPSDRASPRFSEILRDHYLKLAGQCHPERHPGDPRRAEAFQALSYAYDILSDPGLRTEYDSCLR